MSPDRQDSISEIIGPFLAQHCKYGTDLHVSDRKLFPQFRAFWMSRNHRADHPALLGQYRVELTERGYRSHSRGLAGLDTYRMLYLSIEK